MDRVGDFFKLNEIMKKLIFSMIIMMFSFTIMAQLFNYQIDSNSDDFNICNTIGNMQAICKTPFQGAPKIIWSLYKDGSVIETEEHQKSFKINGTDVVIFNIPKSVGEYRIERRYKNISGTTFSTKKINVSLNNFGVNGPAFLINMLPFAITQQDIYNVNASGPIQINASISCPVKSTFFVSIQLSDIYFNRYNHEAMSWFNSNSNNYGSISNFNLKAFAENRWFIFHSGQYYRVKIAFGSPWQEISRLIKIN